MSIENGRPLRVLHVGNVANNAYNNAKLQRSKGIEADVLCFDYYHVMACPEWEDADFSGDIVAELFPDWDNVDLKGYCRPEWFAQGSLPACIAYLDALCRNNNAAIRVTRRRMNRDRWLVCRSTVFAKFCRQALNLARRGKGILLLIIHMPGLTVVAGMIAAGNAIGCRNTSAVYLGRANDRIDWLRRHARLAVRFIRTRKYAEYKRRFGDRVWRQQQIYTHAYLELNGYYRKWFPSRQDALQLKDVRTAVDVASHIKAIAVHYDVIQLYATFAIYGHLAGIHCYTAYEHGTWRDIPFASDAQARITCLGYRLSPVVFMTNSDNFIAAKKMGIENERLVCLPHAFDNIHLQEFQAKNQDIKPQGVVKLFAPARHQWHEKSQGDKGNDRIVHAARILADEGLQLEIHFIDWGREADLTKRLIAELGLQDRFKWHPTMRKQELWRHYLSAHAVIDQFIIPAMGGVTFEAMTFGRRVITYLDRGDLVRFFGKFPPVYSASTANEIADACRRIIDDASDKAGLGRQCRDWIDTYHSGQRVFDIQSAAYQKLIARRRDEIIV